MKIYDIEVENNKKELVNLQQFENKVLLIVNTATRCGFTPQYKELEEIYNKYKEDGFEILDFPCNQFKEQAPGTIDDINSFCTLNYNTTFPRFNLIDVNGDNTSPLYKYLKENTNNKNIKWNFEKFLVDQEGNVIKRYNSLKKPSSIAKDIEKLL